MIIAMGVFTAIVLAMLIGVVIAEVGKSNITLSSKILSIGCIVIAYINTILTIIEEVIKLWFTY